MSFGYVDPTTGRYVKTGGSSNVLNTPEATASESGLMSPFQVQRLEASYTTEDVADASAINAIFKKGV